MSVASMYQTLSCMSRLSSRCSVYVAGMHQTLSSWSKLSSCSSTCCGPNICDIRTLYVSRQCTSSDGDNAAPCLPRGLAVLDWLSSSGGTLVVSVGGLLLSKVHLDLDRRLVWLPSGDTLRSRSKDAELKTLIATYDIPLDLRPRMPDSNFRMSILPAGDTAIDKIPTDFNQDHVDRLKAHIVKLRDIPEGVLVRSGLSRVWRNPMCDPVLRRSDNTAMSIHDFLCMPSLEKATVREETHELGTSILSRVVDHTTPPAPAGTVIPRASPEEIAVTRSDHNVVAKADHAAKRKTSTEPEISTNTTKRTRLSQKVSRAGSSGLAAGDEVEQTDDGTLDDDDQ
ncbi:hypothetical protein Tco_0351322 [Tanacetum coccineum]